MIDYNIQFVNFPSGKVHEAVTQNYDGSVTIFLDKNTTLEDQKRRFLHVMKHLSQNDFEKSDVQEIETEAHKTSFGENYGEVD